MKRGTRMQPVDAAGLPNHSHMGGRHRPSLRSCPVCGVDPPIGMGGVTWKWLAVHFAQHLGYDWTDKGWQRRSNGST